MEEARNRITTGVVSSKSYSIRVALQDGETLFSARDILLACGIQHQSKWLSRVRELYPDKVKEHKVIYPIQNPSKKTGVRMNFVDRFSAKEMINMTLCKQDIRDWLFDEVLTYQLLEPEKEADKQTNISKQETKQELNTEAINSALDDILFEIIKLKKVIVKNSTQVA